MCTEKQRHNKHIAKGQRSSVVTMVTISVYIYDQGTVSACRGRWPFDPAQHARYAIRLLS